MLIVPYIIEFKKYILNVYICLNNLYLNYELIVADIYHFNFIVIFIIYFKILYNDPSILSC